MGSSRWKKFEGTLHRLACLPVSPKTRDALYRTVVLPQLVWVFWWTTSPTADFNALTSKARRALHVVQLGARDLWLLLAGHWMDVGFSLKLFSFSTFFHAEQFWISRHRQLDPGRWGVAVTTFLENMGFTSHRPQVWRQQGFLDINLADPSPTSRSLGLRCVREAWRNLRHRSFLPNPRHEVAAL